MTDLPQNIKDLAKEASRRKPKIFIGLPNLLWEQAHMKGALFSYANSEPGRLFIHNMTENRHHDFARNALVSVFLKTDAEWLLMIDSDVNPHPKILELADCGRKIIAANVFCFAKNQLMPSIWRQAPCEQCEVKKHFDLTGEVKDQTQYKIVHPPIRLAYWDPFVFQWKTFLNDNSCRCRGSRLDPFVFQVHPDVFSPSQSVIECDSVGAAALMIHREVFEKIPSPWFRFLYKPTMEILLTEDHFFCWLAKRYGYRIYANIQMPCSHYKTMDLLAVNDLIVQGYNLGIQEGRQQMINEMKASDVPLIVPAFQ